MRRRAVVLALLGALCGLPACEFAPRFLEVERPLTDVDEVAGLVAGPEGFRLAGTRVVAFEGGDRVVMAASESGRIAWTRRLDGGDRSSDRMQGLLALPGGRTLGYGGGASGLAFLLDADGTLLWEGSIGGGQLVRAAALGADDRVLLAGQAPAGGGAVVPWAAVARLSDAALHFVGETTWLPEGAEGGELLAAVARADGGFLVGGYTSANFSETARLLALGADGDLAGENLHPDGDAPGGRVGALVALDGGAIGLAGEDAAGRGFVGVIDATEQWRAPPERFCAGENTPTRPVSLAAVDGELAVAGWSGWDDLRLFLVRTDPAGRPRWLRTFGSQSGPGAQRAAVAASPAGGLALIGNVCAARGPEAPQCEPAGVEPHFWHLDPDGAPYGLPESFACP